MLTIASCTASTTFSEPGPLPIPRTNSHFLDGFGPSYHRPTPSNPLSASRGFQYQPDTRGSFDARSQLILRGPAGQRLRLGAADPSNLPWWPFEFLSQLTQSRPELRGTAGGYPLVSPNPIGRVARPQVNLQIRATVPLEK